MTDRKSTLLDLARRNFAAIAGEPGLVAAIVTGSVAHGEPDAASDIDTILYFEDGALTGPRMETERTRAEESGGGFYGGDPVEGFGVWRLVEGVKCDYGFEPAAGVDRLLDDLYERADLDLDKQLIVLGIRRAIVLAGEERVAGWRRRTDAYPDALAAAMIERHLRPTPAWVYAEMAAGRGDRLLLGELLVETARNLLGVLAGVNRAWHPGKLKGARSTLDSWQVVPADCGARVASLFSRPPEDAAVEAWRLWGETLDLVERDCPDVDTAPARRRHGLPLPGGG